MGCKKCDICFLKIAFKKNVAFCTDRNKMLVEKKSHSVPKGAKKDECFFLYFQTLFLFLCAGK